MKLEPCPFCASVYQEVGGPDLQVTYVICECNATGPVKKSEHEAIAAWNRRPAPAPAGELVEVVASAIGDVCDEIHISQLRLAAQAALTAAEPLIRAKVEGEVVAWLEKQSDAGADWGLAADKGTTKRAAYGGGSLALHRAAEAIASGTYRESGE